jgi:hypothetical protein
LHSPLALENKVAVNRGMKFPGKCLFAAWLGSSIFVGVNFSVRAADDPLAWPPITAQGRPWAWWWWHGSAVDETNIAHELKRFHDAGLGGVQITAIYGTKGAEARDIPYLTPRWLDIMGHTVDEARRLGMGVDMSLGSGWCFGGPTVNDQDADASVVVKTYHLGIGERIQEKFKRDSLQALVAFWPDGKSIDLTDSITTHGEVFFSPDGNWISTGTNTSPPKIVTVYAVLQKPSGQKVKRPAPGGEGWMLNPAYPLAVTNWLKWFDAAFANYHGSKPQAVFQDSYEYRTDWSPDFFAQFERRRGYKLQTELPALFSGGDASSPNSATGASQPQLDHIARVKYDYRRTISEIISQQSEPAWIDWAHKNGFSTIYQAHGTPANWLDLYGDADMPETEMFHNDRSILISKFASSAAHTQGRALTGAETGTWLKEHFTETLADLKHLADDMFLSGVNRIFYHGACYSPDDAAWPGWLFYASTEMNPRNPIWRDVPALNEYIARCQAILQSGQPDNDVLLYWPVADFWSQPDGMLQPMAVGKTEWFENQSIGKTAHELWNKGYSFDYVSDVELLHAKIVKEEIQGYDGKAYDKGIIQMPGGKYQVVVVPECKYMPLETSQKLFAMANEGADIIFEQKFPADIPGLNNLEAKRKELKQSQSSLKSTSNNEDSRYNYGYEAYHIGRGWVYTAGTSFPGTVILEQEVQVARELMADSGLSFVRRTFDGGWNYLVVNRTETNFGGWFGFERPIKSVVIFDPMTGSSGISAFTRSLPNVTYAKQPFASSLQVHLQLNPGQSLILHTFATNQFSDFQVRQNTPEAARRRYHYLQTNGQPAAISGDWKVKFLEGGPALPADFQTTKLASWTTFPETNCQAFAGTAIYEIAFDAPPERESVFHSDELRLIDSRSHYFLDLGDVRQSARVRLNGKDYGTLITPPFRVVVDNLKPAGNTLEVEVTSVAANRIRDLDRRGVNWKIFKDINLVNENYRPFNAADWPLTDCGLLGPVTLTPVTAK